MKSRQPNSKHCFVCGIENSFGLHLKFYDTSPGEVTVETILEERYQGYPGVVHGGIVAAMLDEAAGRAWMGEAQNPRFMFTAKLEVNYRKNVPVGRPIRLVGKVGSSHGRKATASSAIYDEAGLLLAEASALLVNVPEKMMAVADLDALGWKVYPEDDDATVKQAHVQQESKG